MAEKLLIGIGVAVMLAGCAQFAEMDETRVAGNTYLTGRFYEQVGELETLAAKSPELGYSTARIVQEILPPKGSGTAWVARTKYSKIAYPMTKEEFNKWMITIDANIAKLRDKINAEAEESKCKEEERVAEAKQQEAERANALLLKFCEEQGITPKDVLQTDVKVVERPFSNIMEMEWTDAGLKRQQEIIVSNMLAEVKAEMPSIVQGKEEELCPMLSVVNTNNVLNINFNAILWDGDSKYHDKLYNSGKFYDLFERDKFRHTKNFVDFITNLCFTVDGKSFGPVFSVNGSDRKVAFNKDIYGEFLENKFLSLANMKRGACRIGVFKATLIDIKKNLPDAAPFRVNENLSIDYWIDGGRTEYRIKDIVKFANQYAAAKLLIENEEAMRKRLAEEYVNMSEGEKFPLLSVQPKPQMLMKGVLSGASMKWVQGWLLANHIAHEEPENVIDRSRVVIKAYFYDEEGRLEKKLKFLFFDDALVEIKVFPKNFTVTVASAKDKYLRQLGSSVKEEEEEKSCSGKIWYSEFNRTGFPVSKEGIVGIYTDSFMVGINYYVTDDRWCDCILLTDRILSNYADETIRKRKEAEAKAAEEAKKAKSAAALDF